MSTKLVKQWLLQYSYTNFNIFNYNFIVCIFFREIFFTALLDYTITIIISFNIYTYKEVITYTTDNILISNIGCKL